MHPHRVDVFNRTDDHAVVGAIAHDFQLVFLPALDRRFDQDFTDGAGSQTSSHDLGELVWGVGDARATPTQDVRRTNDDGQCNFGQYLLRLGQRVGDTTLGNLEPNLDHRAFEFFAIFGGGNCFGVGTDQLWCAWHTRQATLKQCHRQIERRLAAQGGQHCIGALTLDDRGQHLNGEWLDVGAIGEVRVGHDGGRVGVRQNHAVALVAQHATCLRA